MNEILNEYLTNTIANLTDISRKFKVSKEEIIQMLHDNKYYAASNGKKKSSVIALHDASEEYYNSDEKITFIALSKKYKVNSTTLKNYYLQYYPEKCWNLDTTVFDNIDSEEKAYWLGFIYADGYIGSSPINPNSKKVSYNFEVGLQASDVEHLKKLKNFLKFTGNIQLTDTVCRLRITNKHLWESLNKLGCTPRKSLTLQFPDESIFKESSRYSKLDLIRHFIRGYWDGDGCLTFKRPTYPSISVISTENFINSIQNYIRISGNIYNNSEENTITKKLMYNGEKAFKVTDYLYSNCNIYLNRKYDRYLAYCRIYEKS